MKKCLFALIVLVLVALVVSNASANVHITTSSVPKATVGEHYSVRFSASGASGISWSWNGSIPGLNFSSAGILSGTPKTAGRYSFTVTARGRNSSGSDEKSFTLTVKNKGEEDDDNEQGGGNSSLPPSIVGNTNLSARVGESHGAVLGQNYASAEAENGTPQFKWTVSKGTFPPGLGLFPTDHPDTMVRDEHTDRYLHLSGVPTTAGTYNFTLKVTDAQGRIAERDYSMTVEGDSFDSRLVIESEVENDTLPSPQYIHGEHDDSYVPYNTKLFASHRSTPRAPYTCDIVAGKLPDGFNLESGVSTWGNKYSYSMHGFKPKGKGTFTFMLKVTDSDGRSARKTFFLTVDDGPADDPAANGKVTLTDDPDPEITGTFANGQDGQEYSSHISASEGTAPYTWSIISINDLREELSLSASGLSLTASDSETNKGTGTTGKYAYLTGNPKCSWGGGYYTFVLKVTDAKGNTNAKTFTVHIAENESESNQESESKPQPAPSSGGGGGGGCNAGLGLIAILALAFKRSR